MREPRSGDQQMRRVLVIDRIENAALLQRGGKIDRLADAARSYELADRLACGDRLHGEIVSRGRAFDQAALAARGNDERSFARFVNDLRESHLDLLREVAARPPAGSLCDKIVDARIGKIRDAERGA